MGNIMITLALTIKGKAEEFKTPPKPPAGITIADSKKTFYFDAAGLEDLQLLLNLASNVVGSFIASWLYSYVFKARPTSANEIVVNGKTFTFSSEIELEAIIDREIRQSKHAEKIAPK
jgi:hypothetical protein